MKNHYRSIQGSLLRHASKLASQMVSSGVVSEMETINLDAFTDEASWPEGAFIGLGEFRLTLDDIYEGTAAMALGLTGDTNLLKSSELVELMLDGLLPNTSILVVDPRSGRARGQLFVKGGVTVGTPLVTKTRPLIPIMFAFTSNLKTA